jgi:hypothetical protein
MALIYQEDKGKKENSKESYITKFNKPFVCMFVTSLLQPYIICMSIKLCNFIIQNLYNIL